MTREELIEIDRLLRVARGAAFKLETMYFRSECYRRAEVDHLVNEKDALIAAGDMIRAELGKPEVQK